MPAENAFRMVKGMRDYIFSIAADVVRDARAAIAGAELLVHGFLFTTGAHTFARDMGIPDVSVQTFPMFAPTRAFPNVALSRIKPGRLSYFSHWLATADFLVWRQQRVLPVETPIFCRSSRKAVLAVYAIS